MLKVTTKLEINVLNPAVDYNAVSMFVGQHKCNAIVLDHQLVPAAIVDRSAKNGRWKIVAAIDFPLGNNFSIDKLKNLDASIFNADGMDIVLTPGRTEVETYNELKALNDFVKRSVNPLIDIRYVINYYTGKWDDTERFLSVARNIPCDIVRIDVDLHPLHVKPSIHLDTVEKLKRATPKILKIGGNVDLETIKVVQSLDHRSLFDVDINQAKTIVNQLKNS